jgi:outer membrane receptor protein involved in Fe transport
VLTSAAKSINNLSKNTSLTADELIQNALSADVRGITRSGVTGIGSNLFMRGFNSLYSNSQPLFVVDGVIWNTMYDVNSIHSGFIINPLSNIEMADVESVTILKDATSIYGSSKPLWVVDGVIMEDVVDVSADQLSSGNANTLISSAIAGLNSDDIESFQILKDGSAPHQIDLRSPAQNTTHPLRRGRKLRMATLRQR